MNPDPEADVVSGSDTANGDAGGAQEPVADLPSMDELRLLSTELDTIDEVLGRLDTDPDAIHLLDGPGEGTDEAGAGLVEAGAGLDEAGEAPDEVAAGTAAVAASGQIVAEAEHT